MIEVALVVAVGETGGELSQIAFADWFATQRAETLWTWTPPVHQDVSHNAPAPEKLVAYYLCFQA